MTKERGFSLVEILIALTIIGILGAVSIRVLTQRDNTLEYTAKRDKLVANMQGILKERMFDIKQDEIEKTDIGILSSKLLIAAGDETLDGMTFSVGSSTGSFIASINIDVNGTDTPPNQDGLDKYTYYVDKLGNFVLKDLANGKLMYAGGTSNWGVPLPISSSSTGKGNGKIPNKGNGNGGGNNSGTGNEDNSGSGNGTISLPGGGGNNDSGGSSSGDEGDDYGNDYSSGDNSENDYSDDDSSENNDENDYSGNDYDEDDNSSSGNDNNSGNNSNSNSNGNGNGMNGGNGGGNGGSGSTVECWDGSVVENESACPASKTCSDGSVVAEDALCLYPGNPPTIGVQFDFSNARITPLIMSMTYGKNYMSFEDWLEENNSPNITISAKVTYNDNTVQSLALGEYLSGVKFSSAGVPGYCNHPKDYYKSKYGTENIDPLNVSKWKSISITVKVGNTNIPVNVVGYSSAFAWGDGVDTDGNGWVDLDEMKYQASFVVK